MLSNIITFTLFLIGFPLLVYGADSLVKGASRLAVAWGVSAMAVGLTVVAYGTSMPELAVSALAVWQETGTDTGAADIAIGNVVGSNIANILLVLGASAVVAPLVVARDVVRRTLPLMIIVSGLTFLFALDFNGDGRAIISRAEGIILVVGVLIYTWRALVRGRTEKRLEREKLEQVQAEEIEEEFGHLGRSRWASAIEVGRILLGVICLVAGGKFLVDGAIAVAEWLEVSKLMISLTIIAIGTSLPEIATCVVAVMRGHRDLAVGNAVGSNIFNLLLVLGTCAVVSPVGGVEVAPLALNRDLPIMVAVALLTLPVFYTSYTVARWEGWVFLALYVAYTVYLILRATGGDSAFARTMLCVVGLIFMVVLIQSFAQWISKRRHLS